MAFSSRISLFVEFQKFHSPLPGDASRTFDECNDHATESLAMILLFRVA